MSQKTVTKCPKCNYSAYSLDGSYMAKLKGQAEKVRRTRVRCKHCGYRFSINPIDRSNLPCPYCRNNHTRKMGFDKAGRRKYMCVMCFKHFTAGITPHRLTEHEKKMIVIYISGGLSERFVAKLLGVGATTVRRVIGKEN